jgi:hypothetical protein
MKSTLGVAIAAQLALAGFAWGQDALPSYLTIAEELPRTASAETLPASLSEQDSTSGRIPRGTESDFGVSVAAHLRFVVPFGSADRDVSYISGPGGALVTIDHHLSWADLLDPGWGGDIEVDFWFGRDRTGLSRGQGGMRFGAYLTVMIDEFSGDRVEDDFGFFIRSGNMSVNTYLVGAKVIQNFEGNFFAGGRMGIGAVHYSSVNGHFGGPGIPEFEAELFEDTLTFAFELRGHGGIKLGPVALTFGMGFRMLLPPSEGPAVQMSSGPIWTWDIDLGAEIGF